MREHRIIRGPNTPTESAGTSSARQRIITDARDHFFAHGFRGVTMDDLGTELGMSKKTLYAHFPSKSALVEAVLLDKFRDAAANLEAVTSVAANDFLASLQQLLIRLQQQMAEIQPSFVRDIQREEPEMFKLIQRRRQELIQRHFGKL